MGNGNGTFKSAVNYAASGNPQMVLAADFDRDGKLDLSTVNWSTNNASILINNGNGTFKAAVNYPLGDGPFAFSVIDLNQDSALDLVATNHTGRQRQHPVRQRGRDVRHQDGPRLRQAARTSSRSAT